MCAKKIREKWKNMQLHGNIIIIGLQYIFLNRTIVYSNFFSKSISRAKRLYVLNSWLFVLLFVFFFFSFLRLSFDLFFLVLMSVLTPRSCSCRTLCC